MKDFFASPEGQHLRYVALVGGVGYGKTEMLKRFSLDVLNKEYQALQDVQVVHLMNFRDLEYEKDVTVGKLLFGRVPGVTEEDITCGLQYITQNPSKVLFILDGLDQYPEKLVHVTPLLNTDKEAHPIKILGNLLMGTLFPDLRMLLSSREHAIRHFKNRMRPDKVIALSGFSLPSIKKLILTLEGKANGERIWDHLSKHSPTLLSVSSIPMFLVFTVQVLKSSGVNPPETSTEVLMEVLNYHVTSEHVEGNIIPTISQLKSMSFKGTLDGNVTFTIKDLPKGLTIEDAKDLLITLPGVKGRNQKLFDGHFRINFCHQSLQEALTALHVVELPISEFKEFISEKINLPHWVIVRRMVSGLILNQKTFDIAQGNDPSVGLLSTSRLKEEELEEKKNILRSSLEQQLFELQGDGKQKSALLELLHALHECGESARDIIASKAEEINLLNMPLTNSDIHVLFSTISYSPRLTLLSVIQCDFGTDDLRNLVVAFKKSKIKIRILLLGKYENALDDDGASAISDMIQFVTDFIWLGYRIDQDVADKLQKEMRRVKTPQKIYSWKKDPKRMLILEQESK